MEQTKRERLETPIILAACAIPHKVGHGCLCQAERNACVAFGQH